MTGNRYRSRRIHGLVILGFIAFFLCSCQSLQRQVTPLGNQRQYQHLPQAKHWQATGKIALLYKKEHQNASFTWEQNKALFSIHLFGPFGQGSTWLKKTKHDITLTTADNRHAKARTAEDLMEKVLGWQVPVSHLQSWMLGIPASNASATDFKFDPEGFITEFVQAGWLIRISKQQRYNGWLLPSKMMISRQDTKVTVVIKEWDIPAAPSFPLLPSAS